jgi:uncharacterized protein (TIGR00730 family)
MKSICIYCGCSDKITPSYLEAAYQMGRVVAENGLVIVYGGGKTGAMGAVADGALEAGGQVIGVITEQFNTTQLAHMGLYRLEVSGNMHLRKARMAELADGFIALPGGFGTLEELFEIITWAQIGLHRKPIGLLNTNGYFEHLLDMIEHAYAEGFIYSEHRCLFTHADDPQTMLESLLHHRHPIDLDRWVMRDS